MAQSLLTCNQGKNIVFIFTENFTYEFISVLLSKSSFQAEYGRTLCKRQMNVSFDFYLYFTSTINRNTKLDPQPAQPTTGSKLMFIYLFIYLFIHLFIYLFVNDHAVYNKVGKRSHCTTKRSARLPCFST